MANRIGGPRARIVDAVLRLVSREGASAVTTRGIAREAGVHLSAVHHQFGGKSALLLAALEEATGQLVAALPRLPRDRGAQRLAVADLVAALADLVDQEPCLPLARCELLLRFRNDPAYGNRALDQQQRYQTALVDLCSKVFPGGAGSLTGHALATLAASVVDGLALQNASSDGQAPTFGTLARSLRSALAVDMQRDIAVDTTRQTSHDQEKDRSVVSSRQKTAHRDQIFVKEAHLDRS